MASNSRLHAEQNTVIVVSPGEVVFWQPPSTPMPSVVRGCGSAGWLS